MTFECAVFSDGYRCPSTDAGDTVYLGALMFCADHQSIFEDLATSQVLSREIASAKLDRAYGHIFRNPSPQPARPVEEDLRRRPSVYFFRCAEFIKIGVSILPRVRIKQVRTGAVLFPEGMDIASTQLVTTEPGGYPRERELHARFKHLRHTGEWFTEAPELTEYIEALKEAA